MLHGSSIPKSYITLERLLQISSFVAGVFFLVFSLQTEAQSKPVLEQMTVEQKVGQLMIWTFAGTSFTPQIEEMIGKYHVGALIAFSRNIKSQSQIARFNLDAQAFAKRKLKAPLFLMIDQEGGTVTRVKVSTPLPSALALGRMHNAQFAEDYAKTKAELLAAIGFNVNLSPVMDISNPSSNSFMSNRVFGDKPDEVTELSMAYARGISAAGLIPTAKHFPGHGGMVDDSHIRQAKKIATLEELEQKDLVPFIEFVEAKFPKAVMMAHLALPNIDPSGVPATYSSMIIEDLLREKYGFKGLVITDDLEMGGASVAQDLGERAVRAFLAGNDMLMLAGHPRNQRKAFESMVKAVKSGRVSLERLDESVTRILETKAQIKRPSIKFEEKKSHDIKIKLEALSREIMRKNFKDALGSKTSQWPVIKKNTRVVVLSSDGRFFTSFNKEFVGRSYFKRLTPETLGEGLSEIAAEKNAIAIYYASGSKTAKWLAQLPSDLRAKVIVINCNNPGKMEDQNHFMAVLNINSHSPESGAWLAQALNTPPEIRTPATADGEFEAPLPSEESAEDKEKTDEQSMAMPKRRSQPKPPRSS